MRDLEVGLKVPTFVPIAQALDVGTPDLLRGFAREVVTKMKMRERVGSTRAGYY